MSSIPDTFAPVAAPTSLDRALPVVARVLFGLPFLVFGAFHFVAGEGMAAMVPVPGGLFWVYFTGLAMIAASVSIMSGRLAKVAAPLLALLMLVFATTLYLPAVADPVQGQGATVSFLKDLALAGGALLAWVDALRRD